MYLASPKIFLGSFFIISWFAANIFCDKPAPRMFQSSDLIGSKIYHFGGNGENSKISTEAFYLDADTLKYNYVDDIPVKMAHSTSVVNPMDNSVCFMINAPTTSFLPSHVVKFNSETSEWSIVKTIDRLESPISVSDNNKTIYIFNASNYFMAFDVITTSLTNIKAV